MVENNKSNTPKKLGAAAVRQQQTQKDRERARARRLEHTTQRRKQRLAADDKADNEPGQRLPEVHRR